jgi:hypothetical protein
MEVSCQIHKPAALSWGKAPDIHWIRGCVGLRAHLNAMEERKILSLPRIEPRPSSLYTVAMLTQLWLGS